MFPENFNSFSGYSVASVCFFSFRLLLRVLCPCVCSPVLSMCMCVVLVDGVNLCRRAGFSNFRKARAYVLLCFVALFLRFRDYFPHVSSAICVMCGSASSRSVSKFPFSHSTHICSSFMIFLYAPSVFVWVDVN